MSHSDDERYIGVGTAAEILGKSRATVKRMAKSGDLPYSHKIAGHLGAYVFDRAVVEYVAANKPEAVA